MFVLKIRTGTKADLYLFISLITVLHFAKTFLTETKKSKHLIPPFHSCHWAGRQVLGCAYYLAGDESIRLYNMIDEGVGARTGISSSSGGGEEREGGDRGPCSLLTLAD